MRFRVLSNSMFAKILILGNGIFWLIFAVNMLAKSHPYKPHSPMFEEEAPVYVFGGRALSTEQYMSPLLRTTRALEWPSFYAARPFFWYFNVHGIVGERLYWGVSVTGYYLALVCLLSFLQWYLVGAFIDYFRRRLTKKRGFSHESLPAP